VVSTTTEVDIPVTCVDKPVTYQEIVLLLEVIEVETMEMLVVNLATVVVKLDTSHATAHKVVEEATVVSTTTEVDVPVTTVDKPVTFQEIVLLEVMEVETMEILVVNKKLATVVVKLDTFQETAHKVVEEATTVVVDSVVVTTVVDVPATTVDKVRQFLI